MRFQGKNIIKICIDLAMTVALLLLMAYQLIGEEAHEWIGIGMFLLFITHHCLNQAWSRNLFRGKYPVRRICQTVVVILILLCMLGSMVSGIILSRYVFSFANATIRSATVWAGKVHMLCAYWGFVFMGIHLGFHWNRMIATATKGCQRKDTGKSVIFMRLIAILIAIYGVVAFVQRDIWNYMTLKNHFAFFNFSEPVIFFLLDYLAVMGLFVFAGHYISKLLSFLQKRNRT